MTTQDRAIAAALDPMLDGWFKTRSQCGVCGVPGLPSRHRVVEAIADLLAAGEDEQVIAEEYGVPYEAVTVVGEWAKKWRTA
jgi:hypothetical protein